MVDPPRDAVEARLATLWAGLLGTRGYGLHDSFFDAGGDSLQAVTLVAQMERTFGTHVPLAWLAENATIAGLAARLRSSDESPYRHLVTLAPLGAPPPVFLVHDGAGDVAVYRHLVGALTGRLAVYGFEPPGLDGRSATPRTVPALAAGYLEELERFQPAGPFVLLGYSFGGLIAFEAARMLEQRGRQPAAVVLVDSLVGESSGRVRRGWHLKALRERSALERARYLAERARGRVQRELLRIPAALRVRRGQPLPAHLRRPFFLPLAARATRAYRPDPYGGDVTLFCPAGSNLDTAWRPLVQGSLRCVALELEHEHMLGPAGATAIAEELIQRWR